MKIKLGNLALPSDAVNQTFAVLGRRGSGKTYTAMVLDEQLLESGQQVVIIDPLDVWWGIRSTGYASSGPVSSAFAKLVGLGYAVQQSVGTLRAAEELFS